MSEACHTMSQSICHCLSFGIPAPFLVVWVKPLVIICGYTSLIQHNDTVFIQLENCFRHGGPLDSYKSFSLCFLFSGERASITIDKNFCRFGELSKKLNNSWKESIMFWIDFILHAWQITRLIERRQQPWYSASGTHLAISAWTPFLSELIDALA